MTSSGILTVASVVCLNMRAFDMDTIREEEAVFGPSASQNLVIPSTQKYVLLKQIGGF